MGHTGSPETLVCDQMTTPGKNPKTFIYQASPLFSLYLSNICNSQNQGDDFSLFKLLHGENGLLQFGEE
jgi:hypothetical protein